MRSPLRDRALTGSWALLDAEALAPMIGARLGVDVVSVTPCYVRYKPETSVIVRYDLVVRDRAGEDHGVPSHLRLFADGRAERQATGGRADRLRDRASDLAPVIPRIVHIPEVDGLLQVFPMDKDLRALSRVAGGPDVSVQLRKALRSSEAVSLAEAPDLVRYKPGRKALLRYRLAGREARTLYGKVLTEGRVEALAAQTAALIAAGLRTPPVVGTLPDRGFVLHAEAPGTQLASLRGDATYAGWMTPLAEQLVQLQAITVPGLRTHRLADEVAALHQVRRLLARVRPDLGPRVDAVVAGIERGFADVEDILTTAHGDFYDDQALVGDDGVILIDFDELRESHPLLDAGNLLAHVASDTSDGPSVLDARDVFCRETCQRYGVSDQQVALFEAVGLFKLAPGPFRRLEPDWDAGVERIVALAEQSLDRATGSAPMVAGFVPVSDPLLPTLGSLQHAETMTRLLGLALDDAALAVNRADVVRHKPGRRAILRYDLADGRVLWGKTFASERGAKVYALAGQVCAARAFGPDVALPAPVAWLPGLRLLVQEDVAGDPVETALLAGDTDLAKRMAFSLYTFHSSGIDLGRRHDLAKELSPLEMRSVAVSEVDPCLGELALELWQRARRVARWEWAWRWKPVHRDLYHEQLLMNGDQLAVLDLDDVAMSEPAVDVANLLAHLMLLGAQRYGDVESLSAVGDVFLKQYRQLDRDLDARLVTFLIGTTLLRLAGIHAEREHGRSVARALLVAAERHLRDLPDAMAA